MFLIVSTPVDENGLAILVELQHRVAVDPLSRFKNRRAMANSLAHPKFSQRQRLFYALSATSQRRPIAALVARVSPTLTDAKGRPVGMLGFFSAENDPDATYALIQEAKGWLQTKGSRSIIGPMDSDTWHAYRFNVGPYDEPPFLMEPTNPDYYPRLWEEAGLKVADRYHSLRVDNIRTILPTTELASDHAQQLGFRFRPIQMAHFEQELRTIYRLSTRSFGGNFLYDDISWDEFFELYREARPLIHPKLVWFAEDRSGVPVGFLFCLIDHYRAVSAMRGKKNWLARLRFARHRTRARRVNFKSIAVLPEHRKSRIAGGLMHQAYRESLQLGFSEANLCLIRDGNPSSRLDGGQSRVFRRYVLYQTPESQW